MPTVFPPSASPPSTARSIARRVKRATARRRVVCRNDEWDSLIRGEEFEVVVFGRNALDPRGTLTAFPAPAAFDGSHRRVPAGNRLRIAGDAEAIIGVLKFGRDARTGGTARDLRVVPPGSAARGSARSTGWSLRIAFGRDSVVICAKPVRAPFVDIRTDIAKPVGVLFRQANPLGSRLPSRRVVRKRFRRIIAPRILLLLESSPRGAFPFRFGRQAVAASRYLRQPRAVDNCVEPRRSDHGLVGMGKLGIVPMERFAMLPGSDKLLVLGVRYLANREIECVYPDAMQRPLNVLPRFAPHEKPSLGDAHHARLNEPGERSGIDSLCIPHATLRAASGSAS